MRREILYSSDEGESWAALIEDGQLVEVSVERFAGSSGEPLAVGDIHTGIVRRILPGMQAAFVEVAGERTVFLHARDVWLEPEEEEEDGEAAAAPPDISSLLHEGQRVLVQIAKEALPHKGARATLHVSIPDRLLVYGPSQAHAGVSRRIVDPAERARLREAILSFARPGEGFIARTAAEGAPVERLLSSAETLRALWRDVESAARAASGPELVRREEDLLGRILRDLVPNEPVEILVEGEGAHERCLDALAALEVPSVATVSRHSGPAPLFEERGIWAEVERSLRPRIRLRGGGTIVITQTEALVAVDVNTSRSVAGQTPEQTALGADLEAAREIARQLRLRDLGGIIVIDFIDLEEEASRRELSEALGAELARDRAHTRVLEISPFGLVQLTRKRARASLDRELLEDCAFCGGSGRVKSAQTLMREIRRALRSRVASGRRQAATVSLQPADARRLRDAGLSLAGVSGLPERVEVKEDPALPPGRFEILTE